MDFSVTVKDRGERLDRFLVKHLKDIARNQLQRLIAQEKIVVNNKKAVSSYGVQEGDVITVKTLKASADPGREKITFKDLEIIEDNKDYLVLNKPSGLIVHKAKYIEEDTLVNLLLENYPELEGVGEYKDRPGIVHRLDKEVSGLMVIAKNQDSFHYLKDRFRQRKVLKKYQCLVHGHPSRPEGKIRSYLQRSSKTGKMITLTEKEAEKQEGAKSAETDFRVLKYYRNHTLLDLVLHTGRTHQIRVHLKSKGIPIVGDDTYTIKGGKRLNQKIDLERIFLVAYKLGFNDQDGSWKEFKIDLPEELNNILNNLPLKKI
jgi:23S rRNA pseudouridine1911/1915/1917 synthase